MMNSLVNYPDSSDEEDRNASQILEKTIIGSKKRDSKSVITTSSVVESTNNDPSSHEHLDPQKAEPTYKRRKILADHKSSLQSSVDRKKSPDRNVKNHLNLPPVIHSMFTGSDNNGRTDDPAKHGNRIRSFPHVQGNWATHIFIPVKKDERLVQFVDRLVELFDPLTFEVLPEFHISLSRTVVIRHHWIDPLMESLKEGLSPMQSCVGDLDEIKIFANDENTRSFLCIEVSKEDTAFTDYVSIIDKCFDGFKLPRYYEEPSFHISVAWCLGNVCDSISEEKLTKAKELLGQFCVANPELSVVFAQNICCRSGNKSFLIPLIV